MSKEVLDVLAQLTVGEDYVEFLASKIIEDVEARGAGEGFSSDSARAAMRFAEEEGVEDATALLYLLWIIGSEDELGEDRVLALLYRGINVYVNKELDSFL